MATIESTPAGIAPLVSALDRAVQAEGVQQVTENVKQALVEVITSGNLQLPPEAPEPCGDRYARHLVHKSDEHGYTAIAMVWGPDQGTPLHDHAGLWCVECVAEGEIDVVQYDLVEEDGVRCRFEAQGSIHAARGSAGSLIPPYEYHTIANPSSTECAITVHVYGGEMKQCTVFTPEGDGWFRRDVKQLGYD